MDAAQTKNVDDREAAAKVLRASGHAEDFITKKLDECFPKPKTLREVWPANAGYGYRYNPETGILEYRYYGAATWNRSSSITAADWKAIAALIDSPYVE